MPLVGQGIVPSAGNVANELSAITRRAFLPYVTVQIYGQSPTLATFLANSQTATGGVASITAPVQGSQLTTTSTIDYSGSFSQPAVQTGIQNAEFDLAGLVTPIPFLGMEGVLQMNHAIVPLIEARMNDSTNNAADYMAKSLFNMINATVPNTPVVNTTSQWNGLMEAVDDGTFNTNNSYGNINRSANAWWKAKVRAEGSVAPTRKTVLNDIVSCQKSGSEMPNYGVMGPGTWVYLAEDYIGTTTEIYAHRPGDMGFEEEAGGVKSGFRAMMVAGVPIFLDPYMPETYLLLMNTNYCNLYIHESANFAFSGFESLLSNYTIGYVGVVLTIAQIALTKPSTCLKATGYSNRTV